MSAVCVATKIPFHDVALLLEKIATTSGKDGKNAKKRLFTSFLQHWRQTHTLVHENDEKQTDDSFYPAMRLILPQMDRQRLAYGMKEVVLAKYYIDVLGIAKESGDAQKLLKYRAPKTASQDAGDFAAVAYYVLKTRCPDKGSLSVADVNKCLDDLALSNSRKDKNGMKKSLQTLLRNLSALEQKWLIRIIVKNMMMGMSETSVLSAFHPDAIDLHNVCMSLEKVCKDLCDPSVRLIDSEITVFSPFRPMLAARAAINQVEKLMDHKPFFVETKFDGDRMQLHKDGDKYMYFSRSAKDYSHSFGSNPSDGFTAAVHRVFSRRVQSCILDGEMVGYDAVNNCFVPKGENIDVKALDQSEAAHQCFVVFDVLLVNGKNLASLPYTQRVENLPKIFTSIPGRIMITERKQMSTKEELVAALNEAIDHREEGLMVKHADSVYRPDKRKGSGWIKIKPEYIDSLSDQLDLIIIGGYYGTGRLRGGMISHFMCGVAVPPDNPSKKPSVFHSFCKVGTGYTLDELKELGRKLQPHWQQFDTRNPPTSIILAPGFKEKPDLWIEPSQSQVVQIKAAEIISSDKFRTGCTLRFPRLERVRDDKLWYDCMDLEQLATAQSMGEGRLTHQHLGLDDAYGGGPPQKKIKASVRLPRKRGVASQFQPADISTVTQVSKMFAGLEFCIVNGPSGHPKAKLEKSIAEHGGSFVQSPGQDTFCVVADKLTARVRNFISAKQHDVVKADWLLQCLEFGSRVKLLPSHMLHTSVMTAAKFAEDFDEYGDSFADNVDEKQLRTIFDHIDTDSVHEITSRELAKMEEKYFPGPSVYRIFRHLKFYLDRFSLVNDATTGIVNSSLDLVSLDIQNHAGTVCNSLDDDVSHVVFDSSDLSRLQAIVDINHERSVKFHCVTHRWVQECIEQGALRNEAQFTEGLVF